MRKILFAFMAVPLIAAAQGTPPAGKIGERNAPPETLFAGIGEGSSDAELERLAAAAAAHPLGTLPNPVRVGGPEGARFYLARLRCADGSVPQAGPGRPGGVGAYGSVVDLHPLDCGRAGPGRFDLIVDLYHEGHSEDRAPAGFRIVPR